MDEVERSWDVAVVGGGLSGLTAAALLARGGLSVTMLERATRLGGRATTQGPPGFALNQGPHALYRGGEAMRVLRALDVAPSGGVPKGDGSVAIYGGREHTLPRGVISLLATTLLGARGKVELGRVLAALPGLDTARLDATPLATWIDETCHDEVARQLLRALFRVATYADEPERASAGAAIAQLRRANDENVLYLDGGWQSLVDALRDRAVAAGVRIETARAVRGLELGEGAHGVRLADGEILRARAVVLATGPHAARTLTAGAVDTDGLVPIRAACLDLALSSLPRPRSTFALGLDAPTYLSVHSAAARLAPEGGAVVHVAKYLAEGASCDEGELEALAERMQPGFRAHVATRRFLPEMIVSHALVTADRGGLAGRRPVATRVAGLFLAGDWVGARGMLADAALASAEEAAHLAARHIGARPSATAA
jgi:phytoene dehydrogenase-like protein